MVKLNIVGTGPGSADYVTPLAHKTVSEAQIVIGAQRSLNLFKKDIHGETCTLTAKNLNELLKYAVESTKNGKNVAILSTGDPGFSGLLKSILNTKFIAPSEINIVTGVSAVQACAAKLCLNWDEMGLLTFHQGNISDAKKDQLIAYLKAGRNVILLPDAKTFTPKKIATYLIEEGFNPKTSVIICESLTLNDEKITKSSLERILTTDFGSLCVMVIKAKLEEEI
ncbi:MAG: precorrin-6y C5,15-methyltransferase (decarboxylating) subunit CbiE [Candidatus Bathyarchaeota archaeon]|uniref:precorrin-6y C5,15-methyltransferase (decarboxylating) subunit CbiE n=1 Tax=Candidatus Bathycorpusculum sp. TaxID=2994959 RepID=UPI002824C72C|nr:precorrin-6y C5,15-methyltransferase (decarboxylating) subunit CbiE [Candidatus Termiticorpusculum sp.]MCL2257020.1 precorrin-6y C5,15-methyltransferase (decarboxylating) subunit CbiE [Candidatus Termiticorpusculum sp.]MCL2292855.1 precorrin-6y C5,15-methyltransferase (decarboxylating) subunit CbiE [Candidatus Termiticorpusculum sp.]